VLEFESPVIHDPIRWRNVKPIEIPFWRGFKNLILKDWENVFFRDPFEELELEWRIQDSERRLED